jgi:phenylalanyl-tRNA synthetase beta subunit
MQPSLVPNLIKNIKENQKGSRVVKIFEIANTFTKNGKEKRQLVIGIGSDNLAELKGTVEQLFRAIRVEKITFDLGQHFALEEKKTIQISSGGKTLGWIGSVKKEILERKQLKTPLVAVELDLDEVIENINEQPRKYHPPAKYTPIIEDISLEIPPKIYYQQVYKLISSFPNIEKVEFLDHFQHYFTFRVFYQLKDQQISSKKAQLIRQKLLEKLQKQLGVKLRE